MLKYTNYTIVFQEVPNETSLAINISGCTHHCKGCHSSFLWEDIGNPLLEDLENILKQYKDYITCVCFMGGDHDMDELSTALYIVKKAGLKTCVYTGESTYEKFSGTVAEYLDYLKVGPYIEEQGPLNVKTTNQRFYVVGHDKTKCFANNLIDITKNFRRKKNYYENS